MQSGSSVTWRFYAILTPHLSPLPHFIHPSLLLLQSFPPPTHTHFSLVSPSPSQSLPLSPYLLFLLLLSFLFSLSIFFYPLLSIPLYPFHFLFSLIILPILLFHCPSPPLYSSSLPFSLFSFLPLLLLFFWSFCLPWTAPGIHITLILTFFPFFSEAGENRCT